MDARLKRLPGVVPIGHDDWIVQDEVFGTQMALADDLLTTRRKDVAQCDGCDEIGRELLDAILTIVSAQSGYTRDGTNITRPDQVKIDLKSDHPLVVARRLVQEDLLIHTKGDAQHHLTGGVLCFPANWTLQEKMNRSLERVHAPVPEYTPDISKRVQRLFDGIRTEQPMMRANWLRYGNPDLYQPKPEGEDHDRGEAHLIRVERQCFVRLPVTKAVIFTIHTYLVAITSLSEAEIDAMPDRT